MTIGRHMRHAQSPRIMNILIQMQLELSNQLNYMQRKIMKKQTDREAYGQI